MTLVLGGILVYVLGQLAVGLVVSRRIATEDDYLVAGRRLGPLLAAGSIFATWFGAETCVAAAGRAHDEGLGRDTVEPFAYGVCLLVGGLVFAAPLWRARVTTLADLLRRRFGPGVERLAAVLLIPTSVLWAAAQVRAFGEVLASSSSLGIDVAIALAAVIAIVYTVAGGLLADVYTDLVQAVALVLGLLVVFVAVVADAGGAGEAVALVDAARALHASRAPVGWLATVEAWAIPICGSVLAQEVVSRSLAARSAGVARGAMLWGGAAYLLVGLVPVTLGLMSVTLLPDTDSEQVLPRLARLHLTDLGYVVFAGALVSAILSTVDSALLVAAAFLSRNLLLAGRTDVPERRRLLVARAGVVAFGALAWGLALSAEGVFALVEQASGFGSAGILVVACAALFSRRGGPTAATLALLAGIVAWIVGAYLVEQARAPYLVSLLCAIGGYLVGAVLDARRPPPRASLRSTTPRPCS